MQNGENAGGKETAIVYSSEKAYFIWQDRKAEILNRVDNDVDALKTTQIC